jgi:hypothetical protein
MRPAPCARPSRYRRRESPRRSGKRFPRRRQVRPSDDLGVGCHWSEGFDGTTPLPMREGWAGRIVSGQSGVNPSAGVSTAPRCARGPEQRPGPRCSSSPDSSRQGSRLRPTSLASGSACLAAPRRLRLRRRCIPQRSVSGWSARLVRGRRQSVSGSVLRTLSSRWRPWSRRHPLSRCCHAPSGARTELLWTFQPRHVLQRTRTGRLPVEPESE